MPETGQAGDLLSVCNLKSGLEGQLWKHQRDTATPIEAINLKPNSDGHADLAASRPSTQGSSRQDPLELIDLEEVDEWSALNDAQELDAMNTRTASRVSTPDYDETTPIRAPATLDPL